MKTNNADFYYLNQLHEIVKDDKIAVENIKKLNYSQSILDNIFFRDFDDDGFISIDDYLIAYNWVMQGKPSSIEEFVKNSKSTPDASSIPLSSVVYSTNKNENLEITSDWDNDKIVDETESQILAKFILSQPKSKDEYNRVIDNYPKVEILPNFLNAKYDYENEDKIDWNDLVIFNEWIRQDKPDNFNEFNENSIDGMDWFGDNSIKAWLFLLDGSLVPIKLNEPFSAIRAAYLVLERSAGYKIRVRIAYQENNILNYHDKVSGLDRGIINGTISHRAFPPKNAFDNRFPRPFEVGHESGSNFGAWLVKQSNLGSAYIQYEFNEISRHCTKYKMTSAFVSPPSQWKLYGATELVDINILENWELLDEVYPEYEYIKTNLITNNEIDVIVTSSTYSEYGPDNIIDDDVGTYFKGLQSDLPNAFISYQFSSQQKVVEYDIFAPLEEYENNMISSWKLQGNNNPSVLEEGTWVDLDEVQNQINWSAGERRRFYIKNPDYYQYYRIVIQTTTFSGEYIMLGEIELYGEGTGEKTLVDWPRGTDEVYEIKNPGEYKHYKFVFEDVHDQDEEYFGLFEIELYGKRPNLDLFRFTELSDGKTLYSLPWKIIKGIYTDTTLPPLEYELIGYDSDDFDDVYIGVENLDYAL
jgi:hypothetical protein